MGIFRTTMTNFFFNIETFFQTTSENCKSGCTEHLKLWTSCLISQDKNEFAFCSVADLFVIKNYTEFKILSFSHSFSQMSSIISFVPLTYVSHFPFHNSLTPAVNTLSPVLN